MLETAERARLARERLGVEKERDIERQVDAKKAKEQEAARWGMDGVSSGSKLGVQFFFAVIERNNWPTNTKSSVQVCVFDSLHPCQMSYDGTSYSFGRNRNRFANDGAP